VKRDLAEQRLLDGQGRTGGIVRRMAERLARLRPVPDGRPGIRYGSFVLTGKACRLPDGSMGQVAIHESDGEWLEVCVPA
jgi:hypothetical protein